MVKILGVSQQVYSNIEAGKVKKLAADFVKNYESWARSTINIVTEKEATYLQKRNDLKTKGEKNDVPVFNGSTSLGNITMYMDDAKEQIAALPQSVFPGCDYAEKACGDSMYPLIMNQAWLVGSALGHSRETTTRGYVNSLNRDGLNTALKDLYGKM